MDKESFSNLSLKKRCELLWEEGQFVDCVKYFRYKAALYALQDFFVEVLCFQDSLQIEKIEVATEDNMVKYLNRINVEALLGLNDVS